jgi:hypothetical protein
VYGLLQRPVRAGADRSRPGRRCLRDAVRADEAESDAELAELTLALRRTLRL